MSERASERTSERGARTTVRTFHDLQVWQRSMELAETVYAITRSFPPDERFGLTNQMRRAAVSVPSNIAEGHARQTRNDYIRLLRIARGSLAELETQTELAHRLRYISDQNALKPLLRECAAMLHAMIVSLERKEGDE